MATAAALAVDDTAVLGGAIGLAAAIIGAVLAFLGTRSSTAADTAEWLVAELREEISGRDATIAELVEHVKSCEEDTAELRAELGEVRAEAARERASMRQREELMRRALRRLLTVDQYDELLAEWDEPPP